MSPRDPLGSEPPLAADGAREHRDARVLIVGAGPAGIATALRLAKLGVEGVVLVDKQDFPRDKTCGSGISPQGVRVLKDLGVWENIRPLAYPVKLVRVVSPGGREAWMSPREGAGEHAEAVICLRRDMDHAMLRGALDGGVRFLPHFDAVEPIVEAERWRGMRARDGRVVRADQIVVANGAHTRFSSFDAPVRSITTVMGWWEGASFTPHAIELIWSRPLRPYYGWLFPESDTRVNIGITYMDPPGQHRNARQLFDDFLAEHFAERLAGARRIGPLQGHPITHSPRTGALSSPGRFVVGEAGRMTNPLTAEGIYQAMLSGMYAAEAIQAIFAGEDEADARAGYEARCNAALQPSFRTGRAFLRLIETPAFDWAVALASLGWVQHLIGQVMFPLAERKSDDSG